MSTSLAQERRIRQRQRESLSQSITEIQQPRLYNDESEEEEEELELVRGGGVGNRDEEAIEVPAKKDEETLRKELEQQYAQKKKARRPNNRPTLDKLAKAVQGPGGFVAIPSLCQKEIVKVPKIRSKHDTNSARRYLTAVFHAYQGGTEEWVPGWNWLEACLMTQQLKGKEIKSFLQHQREAERLNFLSKKLGAERAEALVGQLIEEAKEMSDDLEAVAHVDHSMPDTTGEEEHELELYASTNSDPMSGNPPNSNSSPLGEPVASDNKNRYVTSTPKALEEDNEDDTAAVRPRPVSEEPIQKKRRVIWYDDDEELEFEAQRQDKEVSDEQEDDNSGSNQAINAPNGDILSEFVEQGKEENNVEASDSSKDISLIMDSFPSSQNYFSEQAEQEDLLDRPELRDQGKGNESASEDEAATLVPTQMTQIDLATQNNAEDDASEAETVMASQAMDMIATQQPTQMSE